MTSTVILKGIPAGEYRYPVPAHPDGQVNPDGAAWEFVAALPCLADPAVQAWAARKVAAGEHVMACFARGLESGQVSPDALEVGVPSADYELIRAAARAELAAFLGPLGYRTDHLRLSRPARSAR